MPKKVDYLYKYKAISPDSNGIDLALESLSRGMLWASQPGKFNDPFDCQINLDSSIYFEDLSLYKASMEKEVDINDLNAFIKESNESNPRKIIQYVENCLAKKGHETIQEKINAWISARQKAVGVISLSEKNDDLLMWAHYANYHNGYCLKLAVNPDCQRIKKVVYGNNYPSLIDMDPSFDEYDVLDACVIDEEPKLKEIDPSENELFCYKSKDWEYEKEWRYLINIEDNQLGREIPINRGNYGLSLVGVIFGMRSSENDKKKIVDAINKCGLKVTYEKAIPLNRFGIKIIKDCDV